MIQGVKKFSELLPLTTNGTERLPAIQNVGGVFVNGYIDLSSIGNIYTADGTLTGNRTVDQDGNKLWFKNGQMVVADTDPLLSGYKAIFVNSLTGGPYHGLLGKGFANGVIGDGVNCGVSGITINGIGVNASSTNGIGVRSTSKGNVFQDFVLTTQTPDPSSLLDTFSENHGTRPFPRLTTAQRDAIASPANYLTIVNTDTHRVELYHPTFGWAVIGYIEPLEVASVAISFTDLTTYNSVASPGTGNITNNLTGAKKGIIQKIYHNHTSAPTVPVGWVLRGGGIYVPSTLNIIYATFCGGTRVEYWIA